MQPSNFSIFCYSKWNAKVTVQKYILPWHFLSNVFAEAGRIKSLDLYIGNLGKNIDKKLLHISPKIRRIMCAIIAVQILLYKYCYMQCNVLFSHIKHCVLKIILDALF